MELSLLCGANVLLIVQEENAQQSTVYTSGPNSKSLISAFNADQDSSYTNKDVYFYTSRGKQNKYERAFGVEVGKRKYRKRHKPDHKASPNLEGKRVKTERSESETAIEQADKNTEETKVEPENFHERLKQKGLGLKIHLETPRTAISSHKREEAAPHSVSPIMTVQDGSYFSKEINNKECDLISPVPIVTREENAPCLSELRPYEGSIFYSPIPVLEEVPKSAHDNFWDGDSRVNNYDMFI